ncbi:MAG: DNA polymerase III subunit beta [Prevotella sp.]
MRFTVSSTQLSSSLSNLSKVILSKNTMPILGCFLFEVNNDELTVTASDNENVMISTLQLEESSGDGAFCITYRTILDALKELAEQPISIEVDMETMQTKIVYLNGIYNIVATPADEFPRPMPAMTDARTFTIQSSMLSENISRTIFATAQDELRPVMNGIYFGLEPECMYIAATNGHKLVENTIMTIKSDAPSSFILPKKPATLLKAVLPKDDSETTVKFDSRSAEFTYATGKLICRLTEGRYPNYKSVIPQDNPNVVTIDRKSLLGSLKRVLPFANESSQLVRLTLTNSQMAVSSEDLDFSTSAKEHIVCDYSGMPLNIGFKGTTLTEILNCLESDDIVLKLADSARAGVLYPLQQPEGQNVLMLMMPMLLND